MLERASAGAVYLGDCIHGGRSNCSVESDPIKLISVLFRSFGILRFQQSHAGGFADRQ